MNYWLIKSEADCYSIDDLKQEKRTAWSGVRNYQARNFMRDDMCVGDLALFYHSNGIKEHPSGVYGLAKVVSKAHPDLTALDPQDEHYDPKATKENSIWECVDFAFVKKLKRPVSLGEIKIDPHLQGILVAQTGQRLSVMPVAPAHAERILTLSEKYQKI